MSDTEVVWRIDKDVFFFFFFPQTCCAQRVAIAADLQRDLFGGTAILWVLREDSDLVIKLSAT